MKNLKNRSPYIGHAIMAIAISLICNFSYLLLLVSSQTGTTGNRRVNSRLEQGRESAIVEGKLSISEDGFGYIVSELGDSIYIDHRNLHRLSLEDGDQLVVQAAKRRNFEAKHLYMQQVIERNGKEFSYGALYRGSEQWTILLYQLLFYFVISFALLIVMNPNRRNISRQSFILRATVCLLIVAGTYFISPVPNMYSSEVIPAYKSRQIVELVVVLKSCFMFAMAILYSRLLTFVNREQQISLENERLRNENLTTKYNMLASQINPHFLFNSLSSLSMLVREKDEERALKYIVQLSYTFRYLSQSGANSALVTLREEMQFAEAYTYLFKIRYADKIAFEFDIDEQYLDHTLPSISLQPLIGNTVKHNTISSKRLFKVRIFTEDGYLVVANEKRPMLEPTTGTGVGLSNLNSRYQLLTKRKIEIIDNEEEFVVRLPLENPKQ